MCKAILRLLRAIDKRKVGTPVGLLRSLVPPDHGTATHTSVCVTARIVLLRKTPMLAATQNPEIPRG